MQLLMIHKQVLAFLVFGIFNIGLNEFNPWALKGLFFIDLGYILHGYISVVQ